MNKLLSFLGSILLSCFVVPVFYFVSNYPQFGLQDTFLIVALFGAIASGIAGLLGLVFRDINKVSFLMYGSSVIFWFSHPVAIFARDRFSFFKKFDVGGYQWPLLFVCCFLSLGVLFFILKYFQKFVERLNRILGVFVLVLSGLLLLNGCKKTFSISQNANKLNQPPTKTSQQHPNVYHILLDAHPNQKAMEIIGGDLTPFYKELEALGFVTFPKSRSNYPATMWSVASMLNMNYLEEGWESLTADSIWSLIRNNKVFERFHSAGYNVLFSTDNVMVKALYAPVMEFLEDNVNDFFMQLYCILCDTPIKHVYERCFSEFFKQGVLAAIEGVFRHLKQGKMLYGDAGNVFYAHVLCPHEPCVFGNQAENLAFSGFIMKFNEDNFIDPKVHKAYCENVYGLDVLVLKYVKEILNQYGLKDAKPVIVLHSDHSILYNGRALKSPYITTDTVYGNLLALYIPNEWKQDTKDLKFINLYRWIFNHLFGDNYKYFEENLQK